MITDPSTKSGRKTISERITLAEEDQGEQQRTIERPALYSRRRTAVWVGEFVGLIVQLFYKLKYVELSRNSSFASPLLEPHEAADRRRAAWARSRVEDET